MPKYFIQIAFILLSLEGNSISFSNDSARLNKKNNFIIDVSINYLVPKSSGFDLNHEAIFVNDYTYKLKFHPLVGLGFKFAGGYEFNLKSKKSWRLNLPLLLTYKLIQERNKQVGEYSGGVSGKYFNGIREVKSTVNIVSLSLGLNNTYLNYSQDEWSFDAFLSFNIAYTTTIKELENSISCETCIQSDNYPHKDAAYPSIDLKFSKLFKFKKIFFGPFVGYNLNYYYDSHYKTTLIDYKFNNPVYNLTYYYHFLQTGFKLKI